LAKEEIQKSMDTNKTLKGIDLIGDIHGHAEELRKLLLKLDYTESDGAYSHPGRTVLFVGDYIDRGPNIKDTLKIIKAMVDKGSALALMGNHEYNALCFHAQKKGGGHVRSHLNKNIVQHYQTIKQFQNDQPEYESYIDWFKTLPLYYETDSFRAVHACWNDSNIKILKESLIDGKLTDELIAQSAVEGTKLYQAITQTLKGKELKLPTGSTFEDKDGTDRKEIRIKWWENPSEMTYKSISILPHEALTDDPIPVSDLQSTDYYPPTDKKVFFGHYWLQGEPSLYRNNICCLDYSVAKKGKLVAYRFDNEAILDNTKFVYV
jgi:hypothetical protein